MVLVHLYSYPDIILITYSLILQHASVHVALYTPHSSRGTTILQFPSYILVNTLLFQPHNTLNPSSIVLFKLVDNNMALQRPPKI